MTSHLDRLRNLEQIERDIAAALDQAAMAVQELGKDRPIGRTSESHTSSFLKTVNEIENNLIKQINYLYQVSTTHPHTGSGYGAHKDWLLATQRMDHAKARLDELEKLRMEQQNMPSSAEARRALPQQQNFPPMGN